MSKKHDHSQGNSHEIHGHAHGAEHHHHHHRHDDHAAHPHHHDHGHEHRPHGALSRRPNPEADRPALDAGAGRGKVLFLDAASGIAGDMTIAALVDLGVPFHVVESAVTALGLPGCRLEIWGTYAGAIGVTRFDVHVEAEQPERTHAQIDALISGAPLADDVKDLARRIFRRLGEAESRVHRVPLADVHFHEVGAVDAIADIVGAAAAFCFLGARVLVSALPMGRGSVNSRHGRLPLPAPATLECLAGLPTYDAGIEGELVTPTGAAIVATVAEAPPGWPRMRPERVGYGGGSKVFPDRPNALRAVLGEIEVAPVASEMPTHFVLEANIDDMTGELAAHAMDSLLRAGALDVWAAPVTMKKGRPGLVLGVLVTRENAEQLAELVLRETTTLGVRRISATRLERPRRLVTVTTRFGEIPLKVSEGPFGSPQVKPEFDVCVRAAERAQVPVRDVIAAAIAAFER